jgi:hypothetical protein
MPPTAKPNSENRVCHLKSLHRGKGLIYAARVMAGLVPATRREVFERLKHFRTQNALSSIFPNRPPAGGVRASLRKR